MEHFQSEGYTFSIAPSGRFAPLSPAGEDLCRLARTYLFILLAHTLWMALWLCLVLLHPAFFYLFILHAFLFGCRLTQLLLSRSLRPLLSPPLWERLSRSLAKHPDPALLTRHALSHHPGLLLNLARAQAAHGQHDQAQSTLSTIDPNTLTTYSRLSFV